MLLFFLSIFIIIILWNYQFKKNSKKKKARDKEGISALSYLIQSVPLPGEEEFYNTVLLSFLNKLMESNDDDKPSPLQTINSNGSDSSNSHDNEKQDHVFLYNVNEGTTILHQAAKIANDFAVELILQFHRNIEKKCPNQMISKKLLFVDNLDHKGETALLKAILATRDQTSALLLKYDANPFISSLSGLQPYKEIVRKNSRPLINLIRGIFFISVLFSIYHPSRPFYINRS